MKNYVSQRLLLLEYHLKTASDLVREIDEMGCEVTEEQDKELTRLLEYAKNLREE